MGTTTDSSLIIPRLTDSAELTHWLFDNIAPYIQGRTYELGSSKGAMAAVFLEHDLPIHLSDDNPDNRAWLNERFNRNPRVRQIHDTNFMDTAFSRQNAASFGVIDTLIALNIAEHGFYDRTHLFNGSLLVAVGGYFMVVAPVQTALYGELDSHLDAWKHYNLKAAKQLLGRSFSLEKLRYFNWAGLATLIVARKTSTD
jgi:hypothetical protein